MVRVDCQSHVFPRAYAELLCENATWVRTVRKNGGYLVAYGDTQQFLLNLEPYDPAAKLRDMDAAGIDVTVLTVNIPGPELLTPQAEHAVKSWKFSRKTPERLFLVATFTYAGHTATASVARRE